MNSKRMLWPDLMRIIAVLSMIILHSVAVSWTVPVDSVEFHIFNIYDSLVRFCVPVFIMISGMFFLKPGKPQPIKKLLTKNCLRIITAFCFWSFLYVIQEALTHPGCGMKHLVKYFILGRYHLWFLIMLVGLYLLVPILKKLTEERKLTEYFLILVLIFNFGINALLQIPALEGLVTEWSNYLKLSFVGGYTGYFVLGSYLAENELSKRMKKVIYILGILSVVFTMTATSLVSIKEGSFHSYYGYLLPNTLFYSMAVFLFAKDHLSRIRFSDKASAAISKIAQLSFCVYLVHDFFITLVCRTGYFTALSFTPVLAVPVLAMLIYVLGLGVAFVLDKIPVLNKYIM